MVKRVVLKLRSEMVLLKKTKPRLWNMRKINGGFIHFQSSFFSCRPQPLSILSKTTSIHSVPSRAAVNSNFQSFKTLTERKLICLNYTRISSVLVFSVSLFQFNFCFLHKDRGDRKGLPEWRSLIDEGHKFTFFPARFLSYDWPPNQFLDGWVFRNFNLADDQTMIESRVG